MSERPNLLNKKYLVDAQTLVLALPHPRSLLCLQDSMQVPIMLVRAPRPFPTFPPASMGESVSCVSVEEAFVHVALLSASLAGIHLSPPSKLQECHSIQEDFNANTLIFFTLLFAKGYWILCLVPTCAVATGK